MSLSSGVSTRNRHGSPQRAALIFGLSGGGVALAADPAAAEPAVAEPLPLALPAVEPTAGSGFLSSPFPHAATAISNQTIDLMARNVPTRRRRSRQFWAHRFRNIQISRAARRDIAVSMMRGLAAFVFVAACAP